MTFIVLVEEAHHQKPPIYAGTNCYNNNLVGQLDDYKLMIAQYSENEPRLADEHDYIIWQYTGKGCINGVSTYVDKSRIMGTHSIRELKYQRW
jgi:lysozyme